MELAVIGPKFFLLGFRLAGLQRAIEAEAPEEMAEKLEALLREAAVGVLVMREEDRRRLREPLRRRLANSVRPVVVAIGLTGEGDLRSRIREAIGVDLYRDEEPAGT